MKAIVRQGGGKYYISTVFGFYKDAKSNDDYQRYMEGLYSPYYIVWDEAHERLVKRFVFLRSEKYLVPFVLVVDSDRQGWIFDEETSIGGLDFLPRELADKLVEQGKLPDDIYEKCLTADGDHVFEPYKEIKTEKDIEDLMWASERFHDAFIAEEKLLDDGKLYVLFDGVWGCKIETWFWEDLEYCTKSRDPQERDPYWWESSIILQDGFVCFVDDSNMTIDKINDTYCYFKARHMMYHIIPA